MLLILKWPETSYFKCEDSCVLFESIVIPIAVISAKEANMIVAQFFMTELLLVVSIDNCLISIFIIFPIYSCCGSSTYIFSKIGFLGYS
jgi:hypothetical protein